MAATAVAKGTAAVSAEGDGELVAQRDAPLGGQAVLEGVMMRGVSNWAVAVRKPSTDRSRETLASDRSGETLASGEHPPFDQHPRFGQLPHGGIDPEEAALGEIEVTSFPLNSPLRRHRLLRTPIVRGVVALGESLAIGFRALGVSANAQLPQEEGQKEPQEIPGGVWAGTVVVALIFAIGLFFLLPVGLTSLVKGQLGNSSVLFWVIEGLIRTGIFLGYMLLLSRLRDLRRVFEYHGAEHKTISCFEAQ
ncbi:MAG TPA: DUF1385 domain-containing protein, partial [Solirubrobacteraceae bacterium]|nr:DUF1385 domain-containing protein [Solirubrobacteraceae bacterium]